jgi:hypothetical protein
MREFICNLLDSMNVLENIEMDKVIKLIRVQLLEIVWFAIKNYLFNN